MSKKNVSTLECAIFLLGLYVIVALLFYVCHFHACKLSDCVSDWGSFGSYIGGVMNVASLVSVVLLYMTLREQQKENHRLNIETGYERIRMALLDKYNTSKDSYENIVTCMCKALEETPATTQDKDTPDCFMNTCDVYGELKKEGVSPKKALVYDLYNTFCYLVMGVDEESTLMEDRKKHYLQNLIYSLNPNIHIIVLVHLLFALPSDKSKDMIQLIKSYDLYEGIQFSSKELNNKVKEKLCSNRGTQHKQVSYTFMSYGISIENERKN